MSTGPARDSRHDTATSHRLEWLAETLLFLATAAVVLWQNSRLGVLWDLSYVLDHSYRIALGDVAYRDFPLVHAPLTFLVQAALIKFAGRVFFHHVLYCAAASGLSTVLTWRILLRLLRGRVPHARVLALVLSAPLVVLGIYCIFPHPFYDPDCTLAILVSILLLLHAEERGFPPLLSFLSGVALAVPLFVKQNTGLAFLGSAGLALVVLTAIAVRCRRRIVGYAWTLAGAAAGLSAALLAIQFTAGLKNYFHWTIQFAAERRLPPLAEMLGVYRNDLLPWWLGAFVAGAGLLWLSRRGRRALAWLGWILSAAPFVWPVVHLFLDDDPSERAERLLALWPFLLIVALLCAVLSARRREGMALVLPFILLAAVHGAFLSQQLWGSTFGIWPLLIILIADVIAAPLALLRERSSKEMVSFSAVVAVSLVVAGGAYTISHERLNYANLTDGDIQHSDLPALRGLSVRGSFVSDFEELVGYAEREIPLEDGLLILPGEDPFYYATGRHPRFPVLLFDRTTNPYRPEELLEVCRERGIRWVVIKRELQLREEPAYDKARLLELLPRDFELAESLENYAVYRRRLPGGSESGRK